MLKRSDLKPYQERMVSYIKEHDNAFLQLDMGLGKTATTLTAICEMLDEGLVDKVLIIAPLRVARVTWSDEVDAWEHITGLRVAHILGTPKQRLAGLEADADVYMINRENVPWLVDRFISRVGGKYKNVKPWLWDMVVVDESSSFKSHSSKRFKSLARARSLFPRCVLLTGTPSPNGLMDLWAQVFLLDKGERLTRTITNFRARWFTQESYYVHAPYVPADYAHDEIAAKIKDITVAMLADDYLDLPPVTYNRVTCHMDAKTTKLYREFAKEMLLEVQGEELTALSAAALSCKLLQLSNGAVYREDRTYIEFHDEKLNALDETLDALQGGKALIAYCFISDLERIGKRLDKRKCKWACIKDEGALEAWMSGKLDYLVFHPASASHGLNLHKGGAENLIWFGLTHSLELYQQANARLTGGHRRAGKSVVIHHIMLAGSLDDKVLDALTGKEKVQTALMRDLRDLVENA